LRHNNFIEKGKSFDVVNFENNEIKKIFKFTLNDGLTELSFPSVVKIGNFYKATITTEEKDYYLFIIWGKIVEIIRVGYPEILVIHYRLKENESIKYNQIDFEGNILDSNYMIEIGNGFYYIKPKKLIKSFFVIDGVGIISLYIPYKSCIECNEKIKYIKQFIHFLDSQILEKTENINLEIIQKENLTSDLEIKEKLNVNLDEKIKLTAEISEKDKLEQSISEKYKLD
jgi:hypothetical protein